MLEEKKNDVSEEELSFGDRIKKVFSRKPKGEKPELTAEERMKRRIINIVLIVIGLSLIGYASWNLYGIMHTYKEEDKANVEFQEKVVKSKYTPKQIKEEEPDIPWYEYFSVDLSVAQEVNSEVCGWMIFETEDINYAVLHAADNDKYLHHAPDGSYANSGSIFVEAANNGNFEDSHTIIYGHNMNDTSMFGKLKYYNKEGYYEDHQYFQIFTNDAVYRYQVFAYHDISETSFIYNVYYTPSSDFGNFINDILRSSYIASDVEVNQDSKVITMSTCSTEGRRFVVHAVRVDEHFYNEAAETTEE